MKAFASLIATIALGTLVSCGDSESSKNQETVPEQVSSEAYEVYENAEEPDWVFPCEKGDYNTLEMSGCYAAQVRNLADSLRHALGGWKSEADAEQRALLEALEKEFDAFAEAERYRTVWAYAGGSIAGIAGFGQEQSVRRNFGVWAESLLVMEYHPRALDLEKIDGDLNRVYAWDKAEHKGQKEYLEYSRAAQRHWIRYRDLWAKLVSSRSQDPEAGAKVKAALTRTRVIEICQDPVAPGVPSYCPCYVEGEREGEECGPFSDI